MQNLPITSNHEHVIRKTGKSIDEWFSIFDALKAHKLKPKDVVAFLEHEFELPKFRATALNSYYLRRKNRKEEGRWFR